MKRWLPAAPWAEMWEWPWRAHDFTCGKRGLLLHPHGLESQNPLRTKSPRKSDEFLQNFLSLPNLPTISTKWTKLNEISKERMFKPVTGEICPGSATTGMIKTSTR